MLANLLIFAIVVGVFWAGATLLDGNRRRLQARINRIRNRKVAPKSMQEMSLRRKSGETEGLIHWLMKPLPNFKRLGDRLERAGKTISPKQYVFRRLLTLLIIVLIVKGLFGKSLLFSFFLGIILGVWLPLKILQFSVNKQTKAFLHLFPDGLDLIVRGLRSGLPVSESLVLVSHEVPDPVGKVFANISNTMKLGVPMEKALQETARKLDTTEFNFFATCIVLQRETGGNLSEILSNLSDVLRSRYLMRMKIRAISSEARASAYIIGALPFVVAILITVVTPNYLKPLIYDHRGNICLGVAVGMMTFGMWVMRRMTIFEI